MALRERNDCTEEGLVPRALAIHSSLRPSSTQRWMSSMNFLSETLLFIATRPTARYFAVAGCAAGSARPLGTHLWGAGFLASTLRPWNKEAYDEARLPRNAVAWLKGLSDTKTGLLEEARSTRPFHLLALIQRSAWNRNSQKFKFVSNGVLRSSRDPYKGGPTNSVSYFSFSSANILFCCAVLRFTPSPSVDNLTNSSASRSGPPGVKAISNLPRSVPTAL